MCCSPQGSPGTGNNVRTVGTLKSGTPRRFRDCLEKIGSVPRPLPGSSDIFLGITGKPEILQLMTHGSEGRVGLVSCIQLLLFSIGTIAFGPGTVTSGSGDK
jgi:hypothetical protein